MYTIPLPFSRKALWNVVDTVDKRACAEGARVKQAASRHPQKETGVQEKPNDLGIFRQKEPRDRLWGQYRLWGSFGVKATLYISQNLGSVINKYSTEMGSALDI